MGLLSGLGTAITDVGHFLGAPDLGIGKALGGNALPGGLQGVSPTLYQGVGVASPDPRYQSVAQVLGQPQSQAQSVGSGANTGIYGSGGSSSTSVDPAVAAFYGQQIGNVNTQLGTLGDQLNVGKQNITNSYNDAVNRENNSFGQAQRDYNTNRGNTIQDELAAKQNIDTGVRQQTNALQRLLGMAGSGDSSAAQILAPYATSRQGNIQRQQVQTNYGRNLQALDTSFGDAQAAHKQNLGDLSNQQFQNEQNLESSIANTRAGLLQTLAQLTMQQQQAQGKTLAQAQAAAQPFMGQIDDIVRGAAALGAQYQNPIQLTNPTVYQAPTLASYNYDSLGAPQAQTTSSLPYGDQVTPYLAGLLDKNKNQLGG